MKSEQAWNAVLGQLQMEMPIAAYDTWVCGTEFLSYEDGCFIIGVPNAYARDWLQSRLGSTITRMLTGIMNRTVEIRFVVWQPTHEEELKSDLFCKNESISSLTANGNLNPRYTFENYIIGTNNRLAHAASLAVSECPAQSYNPLFIYGGVGLGKTHLLHAIGNYCDNNGLQVLYVSSEDFTNDLIRAIRNQNTQSFRDKYRQIDILLVDDIQFIAGKESTQEEFFHTFNTLYGQNKQLVVSSDRPPKAMLTLEERLRSRFEWGLTTDIQPPDFETRLAILREKSDCRGFHLPEEVLDYIARRIQSNIRELEGALTRIMAICQLEGYQASIQMVDSALIDLFPNKSALSPIDIVKIVANFYGISLERILSKERSKEVALPRQIAMYVLREEADCSLPQIGELLGNRDHTTVLYGCEKISELLDVDVQVKRQVVAIQSKIFEHNELKPKVT